MSYYPVVRVICVPYELSTSYASFQKVSDIIEFKAKAIDKEDPS
jgi:hypothetical protein